MPGASPASPHAARPNTAMNSGIAMSRRRQVLDQPATVNGRSRASPTPSSATITHSSVTCSTSAT